MRSFVPAFIVIALALLLAGGAGSRKLVALALDDGKPTASLRTVEFPSGSSLSVRVSL